MNKQLNMHEARTRLFRYLSDLQADERIVLCRRNQPFAEIHLLPSQSAVSRSIGLGKRSATIEPSFFDPLPDELQSLFNGS